MSRTIWMYSRHRLLLPFREQMPLSSVHSGRGAAFRTPFCSPAPKMRPGPSEHSPGPGLVGSREVPGFFGVGMGTHPAHGGAAWDVPSTWH